MAVPETVPALHEIFAHLPILRRAPDLAHVAAAVPKAGTGNDLPVIFEDVVVFPTVDVDRAFERRSPVGVVEPGLETLEREGQEEIEATVRAVDQLDAARQIGGLDQADAARVALERTRAIAEDRPADALLSAMATALTSVR